MLRQEVFQELLRWPVSLCGEWSSAPAMQRGIAQPFVPEHEAALLIRKELLRAAGCLGLVGGRFAAVWTRRIPSDRARLLTQRGPGGPARSALSARRRRRGTDGPPKAKAPKEFQDGPFDAAGRPPSPVRGRRATHTCFCLRRRDVGKQIPCARMETWPLNADGKSGTPKEVLRVGLTAHRHPNATRSKQLAGVRS
jgi:hypothetical protein